MHKVTIVGGGNGAFAAASDLTIRENQITLFELPQFASGLDEVIQRGGIELEVLPGNGLEGGFAKLHKITTNVAEAFTEAEIIIVIAPAYSIKNIATLCAPYLRDGQILALCPGNFGGVLFFKKTVENLGYNPNVLWVDFSCMMYACRKKTPSSVWIRGYKHNLGVAVFPAIKSDDVFNKLKDLYPYITQYNNLLETGMSNLNTTLHTSLMLLNTASIDNEKKCLFYRECTSAPSLNNLLNALDAERLSVNKIKGMNVRPIVQIQKDWYTHQGAEGDNSVDIIHSLSLFAHSKMPTTMNYRYVTEDVPFGLIPEAEFLEKAELDHTVHTALINVLCAVTNRDFYKGARTMKDMGIDTMSIDEIMRYLHEGTL